MQEVNFQQLENLCWQFSRQFIHLWKSIYEKTFPGSQSQIMHLIEQKGPQKMSDLAGALNITAGAITTAVNILIEEDYLIRIHCQKDRRIIHVSLTDKGKETLRKLQQEGHEKFNFIFHDLTEQETLQLQKIMQEALNKLQQL